MIYLQTAGKTYTLGNRIFHCDANNRHVLCNTPAEAEMILGYLGLQAGTITPCASLDDTSKLSHLSGQRISVFHRNVKYECDCLLAAGVPKGVDTTVPCKLTYRRIASDTN